jgi:hypothetical protein
LYAAKAGARPHGGRLSDILRAVAADQTRERVSVADLFQVMSHRAFGALMLIFAAPNVVPTPPGFSTLFAAPLIFLATQLALSWPARWLPKFIANRSMSRADRHRRQGVAMARQSGDAAEAALSFLTRPPVEQAIAIICLLLALILFLPIPLGNMLPALAICLFFLAILERDGIAAILGAIVALASTAIVWTVLYAVIKSAIFILSNALAR